MKIIIIGAGNLATGVSLEMQRVGMTISQVYSRTQESAETLAKQLGCRWTTYLEEVDPDGDLYVFSLKDSVLKEVLTQIKPNNGLWVHTAGSLPLDIFAGHVARYGVFYPLQTFTKGRRISLENVHFFLEATNPEEEQLLKKIARSLSPNVHFLSSEKRKKVHLAAVFACNFTNHIYHLAGNILAEESIPHEVILPLIDETAAKIHEMSPATAQTGPAVRFDKEIMERQMEMIKDPAVRTLYQLISQNIYKEILKKNE